MQGYSLPFSEIKLAAGHADPNAFHELNSFSGPLEDKSFAQPPLKISSDAARYDYRDGNDDCRQPGDLFRLMSSSQKEPLFDNIAAAMDGPP
jgi:catalase